MLKASRARVKKRLHRVAANTSYLDRNLCNRWGAAIPGGKMPYQPRAAKQRCDEVLPVT
jgi:hypothetical protein